MSLDCRRKCFLLFMYRSAQISTVAEFYTTYNTNSSELIDFTETTIVPASWIKKLSSLAKISNNFDNMMLFFNALYGKTLKAPMPPPKNNLWNTYNKPSLQTTIDLTPELKATIKNSIKENEFPDAERMETIIDTFFVCCQENENYDELDFKDFLLQLVPNAVKVRVHNFYVYLYDKHGEEKVRAPLPLDKNFI